VGQSGQAPVRLGVNLLPSCPQVEEEFTYGIMLEIGRARAAERVSGATPPGRGVARG
jgi:hypothetical protein